MAKSKYHYYVLVCTSEGAKFVTSIGMHHTAYWDGHEKPYEMSAEWSKDIAYGLSLNGFNAYQIKVPWEITTQPYYYDKGHFEWVQNDTEN